MVRAILAGTKTQTRRIVKPQPVTPYTKFRFYPGDRLWVKETWFVNQHYDNLRPKLIEVAMGGDTRGCIAYAADAGPKKTWGGKLRPSIFMPQSFSRITLEIVSVSAERLQDITEADAKAEGAEQQFRTVVMHPLKTADYHMPVSYRAGYANLWNHINDSNGPTCWEANPWVWKIAFKRITP